MSHDGSPKLLTRVKEPPSYFPSADEFYRLPDGKHLLVQKSGKYLSAFDITDPSSPRLEWDRECYMGYPKAMRPDGILYLIDDRA